MKTQIYAAPAVKRLILHARIYRGCGGAHPFLRLAYHSRNKTYMITRTGNIPENVGEDVGSLLGQRRYDGSKYNILNMLMVQRDINKFNNHRPLFCQV